MGKKGYGKRIMRLDKQERRDISGIGDGTPRGRQDSANKAASGGGPSQGKNNVHLSAMLQLTQAGPRRVSSYNDRQKSGSPCTTRSSSILPGHARPSRDSVVLCS